MGDSLGRGSVTIDSSEELPAISLTAQVKHFTVHIVEVLLLWSQDGAWSRNSDPTDEGCGWEPEVLHAVQAD